MERWNDLRAAQPNRKLIACASQPFPAPYCNASQGDYRLWGHGDHAVSKANCTPSDELEGEWVHSEADYVQRFADAHAQYAPGAHCPPAVRCWVLCAVRICVWKWCAPGAAESVGHRAYRALRAALLLVGWAGVLLAIGALWRAMLWDASAQPPPTACLTASGAPSKAPSLLHPCPPPPDGHRAEMTGLGREVCPAPFRGVRHFGFDTLTRGAVEHIGPLCLQQNGSPKHLDFILTPTLF